VVLRLKKVLRIAWNCEKKWSEKCTIFLIPPPSRHVSWKIYTGVKGGGAECRVKCVQNLERGPPSVLGLSHNLQFKDPMSACQDIPLLIFWGHLQFDVLFLFQEICNFEFWGRSDQWLLRYSTFIILRSSYFWGRLHFKT
jgi:hypothetical protein